MKKGYLFFHQGWTDIFCCLPLLNYYLKKYDYIKMFIRDDSREIIEFYTKNLTNFEVEYIPWNPNENVLFQFSLPSVLLDESFDFLLHGYADIYRKDKYKNIYREGDNFDFTEGFYAFYDIPYINRINCFEFSRNINKEDLIFDNFVRKYGDDYVIYHDCANHIFPSRSTKINFKNKINASYINLDRISKSFFEYIKVIQNAKEIHLIDSSWASMIYQLDAKYSLFSNKQINLYENQNRPEMIKLFRKPINLNNWLFHQNN